MTESADRTLISTASRTAGMATTLTPPHHDYILLLIAYYIFNYGYSTVATR